MDDVAIAWQLGFAWLNGQGKRSPGETIEQYVSRP
jgi:hypothetical protein